MRRNLIIVRAGDESLHPNWCDDDGARDFDLYVSYYGDTPGRFREGADRYHERKGTRWPVHDWIWRYERALLESYERVAFICDDVDARTRDWNLLFQLCDWYNLDCAHPTISGYVTQKITTPVNGCLLRYTDWVFTMCPVLNQRALARVGDTFGESVSGWSITRLWTALLPYPEFLTAFVDRVRVRHTQPTRSGSMRPVLDALGIDPQREALDMFAKFGVENQPGRQQGREFARLTLV